MKLYFIRHGESEANKNHFFAGQLDVDLTDAGRAEAKNAKKLLEKIKFDKVYSSDLTRAHETAKIALPKEKITLEPLLREINVGALAGKTVPECIAKYGEDAIKNRLDFNFAPYGGEDDAALQKRLGLFLDRIKTEDDINIAAFAHGALISAMLETVTGSVLEKMSFICRNCSANVFEYSDGKWKLLIWNYTGKI